MPHPSPLSPGGVADATLRIAAREGLLAARPAAGARRVLVAVSGDAAIGPVVARLAERADVEIAIATPRSAADQVDVAAHENVIVVDAGRYERFVAALAGSHLLIADAPAAHAAARALNVPAVAMGAPATVLQQAERVLDDDGLHAAAAAPATLAA